MVQNSMRLEKAESSCSSRERNRRTETMETQSFQPQGTGDLVERGMSFGVASVKLIIPASISSSVNGDHDAF